MIIKRYKYRIYPTMEQKVLIEKHFGCARFVYNYALAKQQQSIKENNIMLSQRVIQDEVVKLKKNPDYAWLNEVNSQSILASLLMLKHLYQTLEQVSLALNLLDTNLKKILIRHLVAHKKHE